MSKVDLGIKLSYIKRILLYKRGISILNEKKSYNLGQINDILGGICNLNGQENLVINRISPPLAADENTLALALTEEEIENLSNTKAKAALTPLGVTNEFIAIIEVEKPRLAMMKLLHLFSESPEVSKGVHPSAVVDSSAILGENVAIGPNVVVARGAVIGNNTKIVANAYVGKNVKIGDNCLFYPGVAIGMDCSIGNNVIIHHGASIGADGFSFVTESPSNIDSAKQQGKVDGDFGQQKIYKIPSVGAVTICDDVEIGANATIDRGTVENTIIGRGSKIDNLTMIGHNCKIGENCMIVSQVGIAGSSVIGDRCVLAGQVGIADHVEIGADSILMAQAGVSKSFPQKSIIVGTPAVPRKEFIRQLKAFKDINTLSQEVKELKKQLEELKNNQ